MRYLAVVLPVMKMPGTHRLGNQQSRESILMAQMIIINPYSNSSMATSYIPKSCSPPAGSSFKQETVTLMFCILWMDLQHLLVKSYIASSFTSILPTSYNPPPQDQTTSCSSLRSASRLALLSQRPCPVRLSLPFPLPPLSSALPGKVSICIALTASASVCFAPSLAHPNWM